MGRVGIAIRGADPRHTLMLIDGQPVMGSESKYMGGSDEAMRIGAENIERVEIIRGAATAKYGPDAIGGVINIITKAPANTPTFELNAEARYHKHDGTDENKNTWPSNFYMRADSGKVGNAKFSIFGSKRDIMPVYSSERSYSAGESWYGSDFKPSLRYYGDIKTIGASGEVDLNANNKISFRVMQEKEDMQRRSKSATDAFSSLFEPMQIFDRDMERSTYNLSYTGKNDKHDWKIDVNYGKMRENDTTLTTYFANGFDNYSGRNTLAAVDWLEHKQLDLNATMNTQVNDKHLLTYGVGYTDERADGTRLKNAPKQWVKSIDPWSYNTNLWVEDGKTGKPSSNIHNWLLEQTEDGYNWNREKEYNNGNSMTFDIGNGKTYTLTKNVAEQISKDMANNRCDTTSDAYKAYAAFGKQLLSDPANAFYTGGNVNEIVRLYFGLDSAHNNPDNIYYYKKFSYNGKYYGQDYEERDNQVSGGEARIQRRHAFIGDTWQVNDDTIITPVLRIDNSDLFGSHVTANLGMTHNLNGNAHRRLKINVGTGYAEPGMGELYYNWEMYGTSGGSLYGWYWIGNPNLKPEKSVNFDVSIEGESNKTYAKASIFHNTIDDYMTQYFTGQLIDFYYGRPTSAADGDRIYSFKNIGKAEITGFEAEIQQRFNDKWSAKLGYAWLHAINKSDPDMPRTLLDRPQHKIDISFNYDDQKSGWKAALWGDYYIHMLDSNSIANVFTLSDRDDTTGIWKKKAANYQKKTFGIWNFMLEKQVSPDAKVYFGIDNLFNHRDDDRAYMDRTYRIGANIKFGMDAKKAAEKAAKKAQEEADAKKKAALAVADTASGYDVATVQDGTEDIVNNADWFLTKPSDKDAGRKKGDVDLIGDYRVRSNMYTGEETAGMRETQTGTADNEALKNIQQKADHGLEQRLRLGVDIQLGENTNLLVQGSTGDTVDTKYAKAEKRGLHDVRLDRAELNQKANQWDVTIGRLTERMGATGYWFGKEYDGIRAIWTGDRTQVRIGYGDFSKSTGITDSAYNHSEVAAYYRSPSYNEFLAQYDEKFNHAGQIQNADGTWKYDTSLTAEQIADKKLAVMQEMSSILENAGLDDDGTGYYGDATLNNILKYRKTFYNDIILNKDDFVRTYVFGDIGMTWADLSGDPSEEINHQRFGTIRVNGKTRKISLGDSTLDWGKILGSNGKTHIMNAITDLVKKVQNQYSGNVEFLDNNGNVSSDPITTLYTQFVGMTWNKDKSSVVSAFNSSSFSGTGLGEYMMGDNKEDVMHNVPKTVAMVGKMIKKDYVPPIDRAAFIQVRQKIGNDLGLTAWYLRSSGDKFHKTGLIENNGTWGTYSQNLDVANVFGLGAQYRLGASRLSFDWGVNYSETGRYFNGGRDAYGRYTGGGSNPTFWVLRADIGHADTDVRGSWNAFADYKYFQHGAFFGGNGTEALPDRYLDGIRSFTLGAGYVPAKNFLVEAFYTFGAKSIGQRDTLYGAEHFTLGDYTRLQVSYKF